MVKIKHTVIMHMYEVRTCVKSLAVCILLMHHHSTVFKLTLNALTQLKQYCSFCRTFLAVKASDSFDEVS